jgi:hypothetical protein
MKQHEAEELLTLLPRGRTLFTYGKDWYAISLLEMGLRHSAPQHIRKTALGRLFDKPQVRSWIGTLGKKDFTGGDLAMLRPEETETYRLTAGLFSGWTQTTRRGNDAWNIVLQLNLNNADANWMERVFPYRDIDPFECRWHPIHEGRHRTLAWARIDLDWESGEALIEEIQNDRLREVSDQVNRIRNQKLRTISLGGVEVDAAVVLGYWEERLRLSRLWWDEAMLCAAIRFIVGELGLRRIYYHSPVSGSRLKRVANAPFSIYSDLPRRFCFEKTTELPSFVPKLRRKFLNGLWMHRLCL